MIAQFVKEGRILFWNYNGDYLGEHHEKSNVKVQGNLLFFSEEQ